MDFINYIICHSLIPQGSSIFNIANMSSVHLLHVFSSMEDSDQWCFLRQPPCYKTLAIKLLLNFEWSVGKMPQQLRAPAALPEKQSLLPAIPSGAFHLQLLWAGHIQKKTKGFLKLWGRDGEAYAHIAILWETYCRKHSVHM